MPAAYRKLSRHSANLLQSYCPACEQLIAASPFPWILDVMERIHVCRVVFHYPPSLDRNSS